MFQNFILRGVIMALSSFGELKQHGYSDEEIRAMKEEILKERQGDLSWNFEEDSADKKEGE
jgi:hypothetical protein